MASRRSFGWNIWTVQDDPSSIPEQTSTTPPNASRVMVLFTACRHGNSLLSKLPVVLISAGLMINGEVPIPGIASLMSWIRLCFLVTLSVVLITSHKSFLIDLGSWCRQH